MQLLLPKKSPLCFRTPLILPSKPYLTVDDPNTSKIVDETKPVLISLSDAVFTAHFGIAVIHGVKKNSLLFSCF